MIGKDRGGAEVKRASCRALFDWANSRRRCFPVTAEHGVKGLKQCVAQWRPAPILVQTGREGAQCKPLDRDDRLHQPRAKRRVRRRTGRQGFGRRSVMRGHRTSELVDGFGEHGLGACGDEQLEQGQE
jgi:hypothetical protein